MDNKAFGRRVRDARTARELTQEELGKRVGKNHSTVAAWEIGRHTPKLAVMRKLAEALNVTEAWLATGVGEELSISKSDETMVVRSKSRNIKYKPENAIHRVIIDETGHIQYETEVNANLEGPGDTKMLARIGDTGVWFDVLKDTEVILSIQLTFRQARDFARQFMGKSEQLTSILEAIDEASPDSSESDSN